MKPVRKDAKARFLSREPKKNRGFAPLRGDNVCIHCGRTWTPTAVMWKAQRLQCVHCGGIHEALFK